MNIMRHARPKVKRTRSRPVPDHRFGAGILASVPFGGAVDHDASDEDWWAAQTADAGDDMPDEAYDRLAYDRELEERYLRACETAAFCGGCGLAGEEIGADGLCPGCRLAWDEAVHGADIDPDNGGRCAACGRPSDFRDSRDNCPVCQGERAGDDFAVLWDGLV